MKTKLSKLLLLIPIMLMSLFLNFGFSQNPPSPPGHGKGGNQGKDAPIDGGLVTGLAMIAGYGAWRVFRHSKKR